MKAKLSLSNVGGLKGEFTGAFESGKVNLVESGNSGGKSSVIRALLAALSLPQKGDLDDFFTEEALKLGIMPGTSKDQEGFVNIHSREAVVRLEAVGRSTEMRAGRDGTVQMSDGGDPRFLVSGMISNDSRILRQLKAVEIDSDPDDFKWAVTRLSLAGAYDQIRDVAKSLREDLTEELIHARKEAEKLKSLTSEKETLLKAEDKLSRKYRDLSQRTKSAHSKELIERRDEILKKISEWGSKLAASETTLEVTQAKIKSIEKEAAKLEQEINHLKEQAGTIDLGRQKADMEKEQTKLDQTIQSLVSSRDEVQGVLNLLEVALIGFRSGKASTTCPLCGKGQLSGKILDGRIRELNQRKDTISAEIKKANQTRNALMGEVEAAEAELHQIENEIGDKESELHHTKKIALKDMQSTANNIQSSVDSWRDEIRANQERLKKLEIGAEDEELAKAMSALEQQRVDLLASLQRVGHEMGGATLDTMLGRLEAAIAVKVLEEAVARLERVEAFVLARADEQREQAAVRFNDRVQGLMQALGFKEFRTIRLNDEFRLIVERYDESKKSYVLQLPQTLSTSEKLAVALILQLALKETYMPDVPFFLVDDVLEDFDESRRVQVLEYLGKKAAEGDWFVIATKLSKGATGIKIHSA